MDDEDCINQSQAGRYKTYLGINCFSSYQNAIENILDSAKLVKKKSIIVQQMVNGMVSGVLFTTSPLNKNNMLIESSYGLGETIVSGLITPDLYEVNKDKKKIIRKKISVGKNYGIFINKDKLKEGDIVHLSIGNYIKCSATFNNKYIGSIPYFTRRESSLHYNSIYKLVCIGEKIEKHFQYPQDIEWAIDDDGEIRILQTRPITALQSISNDNYDDFKLLDEIKLTGTAAYYGKVTGIVLKVSEDNIHEIAEKINEKTIIVSYETSPDYVPFLHQSQGIITEFGGVLCHTAIISREMKKPCLVGVKGANEHLKNGDLITLDTYKGIVTKENKYDRT